MIATILLLYILNAMTPLPKWVIILVWVLTILSCCERSHDDKE